MSNVSFLYLYLCAIQKANSCLGLPRVSSKLMCQPWLCAIRLCASQSCLPCLVCPRICTWEECFRLLTRKKVRKKWTHLKSPGIRWHSPGGRYLCPISPIRKSTFFVCLFSQFTQRCHTANLCAWVWDLIPSTLFKGLLGFLPGSSPRAVRHSPTKALHQSQAPAGGAGRISTDQ